MSRAAGPGPAMVAPDRGPNAGAASAAPAVGTSESSLPTTSTAGWANITSSAGTPPGRSYGRSMAYDPVDGYIVMFGGFTYAGYLADTWVFHEGAWTLLHPTTSPSARDHSTLAWDPVDGYLLLVGGSGSGGSYSDTWTFVGGNWSQLPETTHPSARWASAMTWDAADSQMLLFGGCVGGSAVGDTWSFQNGSWTQLFPVASPSKRENVALQFDPVANETILFGGDNYYAATYGDTWAFSAGNWTQLHPLRSPSARTEAGSAWDDALGAVVVFGGSTASTTTDDTWMFSGGAWTVASLPQAPTAREFGMMAFDPVDSELVLFSGAGAAMFDDTWIFYQISLSATVTPPYGVAPLTVNYSAAVSGARGAVQYLWSFGDGNLSVDATAEETIAVPGLYFASISAEDANGSGATATTMIRVIAPLVAAVVAAPASGMIPLTVQCQAIASGGAPPYTFLWSSGSGNTSTDPAPTFVYGAPGAFVATVAILDSAGASQLRSFNITVTAPTIAPLVTGIAVSSFGGPAPWPIWFAANVSGGLGPYALTWTFGDGVGATGLTAVHTYEAPGALTASLSVTDARSTVRTASVDLTIGPALWLAANASFVSTEVHRSIEFTGEVGGGAPPYVTTWTFGDGNASAALNASHSYGLAGTYNATLTVVDSMGSSGSAVVALTISAAPLLHGPPPAPNGTSTSATPISPAALVSVTALLTAMAVGGAILLVRRWRARP